MKKKVEALEYGSLSNTFKFGGQLENRYDYINVEDKTTATKVKASNGYFSTFFRLNMQAKPTDSVEFFGRLGMAKYWNDVYYVGSRPDQGIGQTASGGRNRANPAMYVERSFVNWYFAPTWTLTVGRLPTIDGGPKHFSQGTSTMGSYPLAAYASVFDGAALTKAFSGQDWGLKTRLIYTPFQTPNFTSAKANAQNVSGQSLNDKADV